MNDLLFEIGTEEIPAGFLNPAAEQLKLLFESKAKKLNLHFESAKTFSTPRRLALLVANLADRQQDSQETSLGPSRKAAYDSEGQPTKAAEGFARSKRVSVDDLSLVETARGEYLQLTREVKGEPSSKLLPDLLKELIFELSFAKSMRWGSYQNSFARPIQWLVALLGESVIDIEHDGIVSGRFTRGHRFMAPGEVEISRAAAYEDVMESGSVIPDFDNRKQKVLEEIKNAAAGTDFNTPAAVAIDELLLNTVTNLVEKPYGVCGRFDDKFLQLPDEVLVTSMREHQKYFPVVNGDDTLLSGFVAVNNTGVKNVALTREGHERVLRARLEDALFFFESDKKIPLEERVEKLSGIIFQAKLGSVKEKMDRVVKLTRLLCDELEPTVAATACRAAELCKADLITDMVGEFPSLQGIMGSAYALHDNEKIEVAEAIREHYMPLRSGAELPSSAAGAIVGLADRIDTIAGCFGIGQQPTGTADPFGLRRLSLAVLHIIEDRDYSLVLPDIVQKALALYGDKVNGSSDTVDLIVTFIRNRFNNDCVAKGVDSRAVEAVTSVIFLDVNDCLKRIEAFSAMKKDASFEVLSASFKRVRNIVKDNSDSSVDQNLFEADAEKQLWSAYQALELSSRKGLQNKDYLGLLENMLQLKNPIDRYFDEVMVMAEDKELRKNRLNMMTAIGNLILEVGDISRMHVG